MSAILRDLPATIESTPFVQGRLFSLWRRWEREGANFHKWYLVAVCSETSMLLMAGLRGQVQWDVMFHDSYERLSIDDFGGFHDEPFGEGRVVR